MSARSDDRRSRLLASGARIDRLLHELKQPLNLIRVVAQDLRLDIRNNRLQLELLPESLREIEETVDRMVGDIDRLRRSSRPRRAESEPGAIGLAAVCRDARARVSDRFPAVSIAERYASSLRVAVGDPSSLEHAVYELLENACLAVASVEAARRRVEISTFARGTDAVVSVRDHGAGVPRGARDKIFDPFFTTRGRAAGLGLSAAGAQLAAIGGRIELADSGRDGTTFEIVLHADA